MTATPVTDELIFAGRGTLCECFVAYKYKVIRFSGPVLNRDWEFIRDDLYPFLKALQGACVLDLSGMPDFDSTLYTVLIWMRVLTAGRNVRFLVVAGETVEARLKAAGVGKWVPIIRDIAVFRRLVEESEGDEAAARPPAAAGRACTGYSSRSAA